MLNKVTEGWCPKCTKPCVYDPVHCDLRCAQHGYVVDKIYRCRCGRQEEFRAINNVPPYCHYCGNCTKTLSPEVRAHLIGVVARSPMTWSPA